MIRHVRNMVSSTWWIMGWRRNYVRRFSARARSSSHSHTRRWNWLEKSIGAMRPSSLRFLILSPKVETKYWLSRLILYFLYVLLVLILLLFHILFNGYGKNQGKLKKVIALALLKTIPLQKLNWISGPLKVQRMMYIMFMFGTWKAWLYKCESN